MTGPDPTGPDSPFQRIIDLGGVLAGLGVSLNYMNMIHVLDSRYRHRYPFAIYSAKTYVAHSIDHARQSHRVTKLAMLNELQVNIKPSRIVHALHPGSDIFRSAKIGSTDFFIWELAGWEPLCVTHLEQALDAGGVPCWLADVETQIKVSQSMAANNGPRAG